MLNKRVSAFRHDTLWGHGIALRRKHSASQQDFRRLVGMVPDHAVAGVEARIQVHVFDQAFGHYDAEGGELVGQRVNSAPVEGRLMQAVVEDVVRARGSAVLVAQHRGTCRNSRRSGRSYPATTTIARP